MGNATSSGRATAADNLFLQQPEFIDSDPRTERRHGYRVEPEFMLVRAKAQLPPSLIAGKRVLDLGCCLGAMGAWSLTNGAAFYQGVEIQPEFVAGARRCLGKYYPQERWSIAESSIESFLEEHRSEFDVTLASGILYGGGDPLRLLQLIAGSADVVVIESRQPTNYLLPKGLSMETRRVMLRDPAMLAELENASYIHVGRCYMNTEDGKVVFFPGFCHGMGAVKKIMEYLGFDWSDQANAVLKQAFPRVFSPLGRFLLHFQRNHARLAFDFGFVSAQTDPGNVLGIAEDLE